MSEIDNRYHLLEGGVFEGFQRCFRSGPFGEDFTNRARQVSQSRIEESGDDVDFDYYYLRVRLHNGNYAWSSPIWVG